MADRDDGTAEVPRLRSAVPSADRPLAGSGAAPDEPAETPPAEPPPAAEPEPKQRSGPEPHREAEPEPPEGVEPVAGAGSAARLPFRRVQNARGRIRAWSDRPNGRLAVPALLLAALTLLAGVAGAVVVPALGGAAERTVDAGADATLDSAAPSLEATARASGGSLTPSPPPTTVAPSTPAAGPVTGGPTGTGAPATAAPAPPGRPSDVLAGWAQQVGNRVGIPPVALQAYGYAELVLAQTSPGCHLSWTTLAAIGLVESNHGRANGAALAPDGQALPQIVGLPLDGQGGRQRIADTDRGQLDGDPVLDRAVGPMQFIPSTWLQAGLDADNDGANNPHDIDDAALAAANYLCGNGRDLATARDWWAAILSYNDVRRYAQSVFDAANRYGAASRT
ncbi:MAG TPA: lytic murein transglycosylase [Micromonosporaceae bacterium]|nr:lytic murein transglycosylase [Micromonosporaceae bacterium]